MALPSDDADDLLRRTGALVRVLARAAFAKFWRAVQGGAEVREAFDAAQQGFTGSFAQELGAAFSRLLLRSVGTPQVRALPVSGIPLSRRLYQHAQQTGLEVEALVREHAQGLHQARELALRLYDGYNPADGLRRPLEGSARGALPKALRTITSDPLTRVELTKVIEAGQKSAARLKTPALRAAYGEALTAWEAGKGEEALKRRLEVAVREKNRYMAERISRTELARAYQAEVAAEFMADETISVLQVRMNPAHPKPDICDLHARANLFGLGPGCYPKAKAPRPPFHPHCFCKLVSRPDLDMSDASEANRQTPAEFVRSLPESEAAQVMGSKDRAQDVMGGEDPHQVINRHKDRAYRLAFADSAGKHPLLGPVQLPAVSSAYEIAKSPGGKHHGFLRLLDGWGARQRQKAMDSMREEVTLHLDKIARPGDYVPIWGKLRESHRQSLLRGWRQEVAAHREQIAILEGYADDHQ